MCHRYIFAIMPVLLILTLALSLCGCGKKEEEKKDPRFVFTTGFEENELFFIGEKKCYLPEALLYISTHDTNYEDMYGPGIMDRNVNGTEISDKLTGLALSRLAQIKTMDLMAADRGVTLSDRDLDKCTQAADRYMRSLSASDISELGMTYDVILGMFQDYALAWNVYEDVTKDINPEISDDEARTITLKAVMITSPDQAKALQLASSLYAEAEAGKDFDSLADGHEEASLEKISFSKDTSEYSRDFVDACFRLSTDEISAPMVVPEGVCIVKCISSFDQDETDANKARIVEKRRTEAFSEVYSDFASGLYAGFNSDLWDEQHLTNRRLDTTENFFQVYEDIFSIL
ncbi:MAG: peptidyl-prolyl cis-trans isomerase [Lachnospiraceae bacterium]|nr:peptidyl-prolyl cis-trans isomerase [Lachnospiraceae bacterium]